MSKVKENLKTLIRVAIPSGILIGYVTGTIYLLEKLG